MIPVVGVAGMRAADADAADAGVTEEVLIGRAGAAVARTALWMLRGAYGRRVAVVAGPGNNGADGQVAADGLRRRGVRVMVIRAPGRDQRLSPLPVCDLVIDAAYGTGFRGTYEAPDTRGAPVLAVDIPSGVDGDTGAAGVGAVRADITVTFAALKPGLLLGDGVERAGRVIVADIGLRIAPPSVNLVEDADVPDWLPRRLRDAHKWQRAVWVVAGSAEMMGAGGLCARAAQRAGAGMVYLSSPGVSAEHYPAGEAIARPLPPAGWAKDVLSGLGRFGSLVVGPGLGRSPAVAEAVARLVAESSAAVVLDADGLNAFADRAAVAAAVAARPPGAGPVLLTPHEGEFSRLCGSAPGADRLRAVRCLAADTGTVVLLKGPTTVVASAGGTVLLAASGDARLATAGTGDVLAGTIGALLAAGVDVVRAAAMGAHLHGRAARLGPSLGLVAGDVAEHLPAAFAACGAS